MRAAVSGGSAEGLDHRARGVQVPRASRDGVMPDVSLLSTVPATRRVGSCVALIVALVVVVGCDLSTPSRTAGPSAPPAPQWPVAGHDPQRTSTGSVAGPRTPRSVNGWPRQGHGTGAGSPVVAGDGTLYTAIGDGLYALRPDGTETGNGWPVAMAPGEPPRYGIGRNGAVFLARSSFLTSLAPSGGTIREGWPVVKTGGLIASVMLVTDDTVYIGWIPGNEQRVAEGTVLEAYTYGGQLRQGWPVTFPREAFSAAATGRDGTLYLAGRTQVHALAADGRARPGWPFAVGDRGPIAALAIGPDDTIYAAALSADTGNVLYALAPDGTARPGAWPYRATDGDAARLAVASDGSVFDLTGVSVHVLSAAGGPALRWKTGDEYRAVDVLALGVDGTAYLGGPDNAGLTRLTARAADGSELPGWPVGLAFQDARMNGLAISSSGVLYVTATDGTVLAYRDAPGPTPSASAGAS